MASEYSFSWDPRKAAANLRKHGVGFPGALTAFADPLSITVPDPTHSRREERFLLLGVTSRGRLLVVAHTELPDQIRIINARPATRAERETYEKD